MQKFMGKNLKKPTPTNYSDKTIHNIKNHFGAHHKNKYMAAACVRQGLRRHTHRAYLENKFGLNNAVYSYDCAISCVASACIQY